MISSPHLCPLAGEGGEVMEGGFQRFVHLFFVNGYCVIEDYICVDLSGVLDGRA